MGKTKRDNPGRPGWEVLTELKRSDGLSVGQLAGRLGMSYMGMKTRCLALEKSGHVTSRNAHNGNGRPLLVYRLSARGQERFPESDNRLALDLLDEARALFGPAAAEKLLFKYFERKASAYALAVAGLGSTGEKLAALARLRETEGCMPRVEGDALVESHCPLLGVFEAFPQAAQLEEALISQVLGTPVRRIRQATGDHYQIRFEAFRCGAATEVVYENASR